jgi:hypothetical protein
MLNVETEIHIAPGPSAGGCLQAGLGLPRERLLINHDLVSCGPLPSLDSPDDWLEVRQAYLRSLYGEDDPTFAFAEQDRDLLRLALRERPRRRRLPRSGEVSP